MTDTLFEVPADGGALAVRTVTIDVRGAPRPQGSMRTHVLPGGKVATRYPPAVWEWRHQVQQAAVEEYGAAPAIRGPVELRLGFDLPRPASHYGTGRNAGRVKASAPAWPSGAPDTDKLARCIGDAQTDAGVWLDDAQVVILHAAKRYTTGTPGVHITITELA